MIVGIDSYHEKTKKGSSVAGFVASINATISRYSVTSSRSVAVISTADSYLGFADGWMDGRTD